MWSIQQNQLVLNFEDRTIYPSLEEIVRIERGEIHSLQGFLITKPTTEIHGLDMSLASYYSTLMVTVYLPSDSTKMRAALALSVKDPDFQIHDLEDIPRQPYCICNQLVLLLDEIELSEVSTFINKHALGQIDYHELSEIFRDNFVFLNFIEDDSRCFPITSISPSADLSGATLYPYQQDGVSWMNSVVSEGVGCVLADEMGLGKTFQIIALIALYKDEGKVVVIAPNSLLENWRREFAKFAPGIRVLVHRGNNRSRRWQVFLDYDVVITSYDTVRNDFALFSQFTWNIMVLDEAQSIKNHGTQRSRIVRELPKKTGIAVSGTPFENHLTDIWSIFDFCFRGLLGDQVNYFVKTYPDSYSSAKAIERIISPLLIRRRVEDVKKDLPERVIIPAPLEMGYAESEGYEIVRKQYASENDKLTLGSLVRLRQYCALPSILNDSLIGISPSAYSQKFERLIEILDEIYNLDEKVLIFTRYRAAQTEISKAIQNRYFITPYILNGAIPQNERQILVDTFSKMRGFSAMIINPTVGGTGLNITAANHVIFYTLEWNPALEDQCLARALRIGQTKTVFVHRMFYADTVEEVINERLERKREIGELVVVGTDGKDNLDIQRALKLSPFIKGAFYDEDNL